MNSQLKIPVVAIQAHPSPGKSLAAMEIAKRLDMRLVDAELRLRLAAWGGMHFGPRNSRHVRSEERRHAHLVDEVEGVLYPDCFKLVQGASPTLDELFNPEIDKRIRIIVEFEEVRAKLRRKAAILAVGAKGLIVVEPFFADRVFPDVLETFLLKAGNPIAEATKTVHHIRELLKAAPVSP